MASNRRVSGGLVDYFMFPFPDLELLSTTAPPALRNPIMLMRESMQETAKAAVNRYKLVIDTTADDSIFRALIRSSTPPRF